MNISSAVIVNDLIKRYKDFELRIPSLVLDYGKTYGFYGENGSGKTTLLKVIASIVKQDMGEITFKPAPTGKLPEKTILFQEPRLLNRTVKDNLIYPLKIKKLPFNENTLKNVLNLVGMNFEKFKNKKPQELSGGERKRVSLAQKIIFDPDIIILDEPTANVDLNSIEIISSLIDSYKKNNKLVLVSSHDHSWLSDICDEIFSMKNGKFIL